jgi:hypothetical protein
MLTDVKAPIFARGINEGSWANLIGANLYIRCSTAFAFSLDSAQKAK